METALSLDLALRGAAAGFALVLAGMTLGLTRRSLAFACLGFGLAAYAVVSAPAFADQTPAPLFPLVLVAMAVPAILWWAGLEFFDRAERFRPFVAPLATAFVVTASLGLWWGAASALRGAATVGLYLHLVYVAWESGPSDLVEARRGARRVFLALGATLGIIITAEELGLLKPLLGPEKHILQSASLSILLGWFLVWFAGNRRSVFSDPPGDSHLVPMTLTAQERAVLDRLAAAMEAGVWQKEGLTIGQLAASLDTTEHRLRRVINQGLGYRNFTRFLNERRIARAREILSDSSRADMPVLTLAYEVGFASLGPFNRAFREITGQSPTEYRSERLLNPDKAAPISE